MGWEEEGSGGQPVVGPRKGAGGGDPGPAAGGEGRTRLRAAVGGARGPGCGGLEPCKADPLSVGLWGWTGSRISSDCMGWEWAPGGVKGGSKGLASRLLDAAIIVSEVPPAWAEALSLRLF